MEAARGAAVVLVFLGEPSEAESEGFDRDDLDLPAVQLQMIEAVSAVNPSVAVVLSNGGLVLTGPLTDRAAARPVRGCAASTRCAWRPVRAPAW